MQVLQPPWAWYRGTALPILVIMRLTAARNRKAACDVLCRGKVQATAQSMLVARLACPCGSPEFVKGDCSGL